jgi:hypothetical protein
MDSILDFAKGAITTTPISRVSHLEMDTKSGREIHRLIKTLIVELIETSMQIIVLMLVRSI